MFNDKRQAVNLNREESPRFGGRSFSGPVMRNWLDSAAGVIILCVRLRYSACRGRLGERS